MTRRLSRTVGIGLTGMLLGIAPLRAEEAIRIAFIEPFSGNLAEIGDADLKDYNFILSHINAKGGALGSQVRACDLRQQNAAGRRIDRAQARHRPRHPDSYCHAPARVLPPL